jgi:hypothetical protein
LVQTQRYGVAEERTTHQASKDCGRWEMALAIAFAFTYAVILDTKEERRASKRAARGYT